jgi:hypothetical protein
MGPPNRNAYSRGLESRLNSGLRAEEVGRWSAWLEVSHAEAAGVDNDDVEHRSAERDAALLAGKAITLARRRTSPRRRQQGCDPRVVEIAWRAQRRLHSRWRHLGAHRGKPSGKVAVACARELAAFMWEAATLS